VLGSIIAFESILASDSIISILVLIVVGVASVQRPIAKIAVGGLCHGIRWRQVTLQSIFRGKGRLIDNTG